MEEAPENLEHKRAILEYWMLVEFFSPYILENVLDSRQRYQKIYVDEPLREPLPWLHAPVLAEDDAATPFAKAYHLYLGLFSVEETADRARHAFAPSPSQWQSVNWRSCADASSTTCFARLTVTTHGIPLFSTLSLSTLPWAHGKLLDGQKESLTVEEYWKGVNRLLELLREEFAPQMPLKLMKRPKTNVRYLDLESLFTLARYLQEWANFRPSGYPCVLIEPLVTDATVAAREPKISSVRDIPILNSFYIHDLESAKTALDTQKGMPIDCYLSDRAAKRVVLESEEGQEAILKQVRPEKMPSGRWPDGLLHHKNVMQQFAINAALESDAVFSVNGPPGTGKTSLLKEIIAENVVKRAVALAACKTAQSAFVGRHALSFESSDPIFVSELDPSLLGYEMVVVSSNNTAVQNLSAEIPLRAQLDAAFQYASYLEPVACKVQDGTWGLIAATLGNAENCRQFVEAVFALPSETIGPQRIWEWIDGYKGLSFHEAKERFIALKALQEEHLDELEYMAFLHDELDGHTVDSYAQDASQALFEAEKEIEQLAAKKAELQLIEAQDKELLALQQARERLWKEERPNVLSRMMDQKAAESWNEKQSLIRQDRLAAIEKLHASKSALHKLLEDERALQDKENLLTEQLLERILQFYTYEAAYNPMVTFPKNLVHTDSYYQSEATNRVRSELFIAALQLHEAWLAEVLRTKGGFRGNLMAISHLLQGKSPTTARDTLLAWQSLFLVLPVISSTFASVGRLFRYLEPQTFGWVLIDEAGQAVPQAAVGAIWRARRVLSIGDPFQIEPICTIPQEVIDGMAKSKIKDYTLSWAPSQMSVQNLMDRVSTYGSHRTIRDESYWLGSPLRVHRRCQEPMFSIANAIAYECSMQLATEPAKDQILPSSCWWDVGGATSDRQYVPAQGEALAQLLQEILVVMPTPNLFIISPFREVITQLQYHLLDEKPLHELFSARFPAISFHNWVRSSIGTVHTFQGKQAESVFFVLGADKSTLGAIDWASRKPNLLNVALTRARSRFYMLGDYNLWRIWPHFDIASKKLERRKLQK